MISLLSFVYLTQDISAVSESATDIHNWLDYFDSFIHPLSAHTPTGFTSVLLWKDPQTKEDIRRGD